MLVPEGNGLRAGAREFELSDGILRAFPDMTPAGDPVWVESNNHTAFRSLPVRFTPKPAQN